LFGRKVATFLEPATIEQSTLRRLLEQLRFDKSRFCSLATAAQFGGAVKLVDPDDKRPLWQIVEPFTFADSYLAGWARHILRNGDLPKEPFGFLRLGTGNVSMSARTFKRIGGFDVAAQPMEDWEFGARCQIANIPVISSPEIESYHQLHPPDPFLLRLHRRAMNRFRRKHPDLIASILESGESYDVPGVNFIRNRLSGRPTLVKSPNRIRTKVPCCSLTFDDGPHPISTLRILELLRRFEFLATFFVIMSDAVKYPAILEAVARSGCELGVHGWQHRPVREQTTREIVSELRQCMDTLFDICGVTPRYCRPPYGITSASYAAAAKEVGLQPVGWHFSPRDWASQPASDLIADIATADIWGRVLLLHDGSGDTNAVIDALSWLLESAKEHAVSVMTLSQFSQHLPLPGLAGGDH
jgi:peptidoglycan-N-acetylglucosamine deacetylase